MSDKGLRTSFVSYFQDIVNGKHHNFQDIVNVKHHNFQDIVNVKHHNFRFAKAPYTIGTQAFCNTLGLEFCRLI